MHGKKEWKELILGAVFSVEEEEVITSSLVMLFVPFSSRYESIIENKLWSKLVQ